MRIHYLAIVAAASIGLAGGAMAAEKPSNAIRPSVVSSDFVFYALQGGMAEIADAKVAQQKSSSPAVKQFAAEMIKDHGAANNELGALAKAKGVVPPHEPDMGQRAANKRLAGMTSGFDQAYIDHEISDHETTISLFRREADEGTDADMKSFAQKTLPTLQNHLAMAKALKKS